MKHKHTLSLLALATCVMLSSTTSAQTGTITVKGEIVADSCTANIVSSGGSGGSGNYTVNLDPVSYGVFTAAGVTAGEKPFTIELTGCTVSGSNTQMWAHFTGASVNADGHLATNSSKVSFQLTDGFGGAPIKAGGSAASTGPGADQGSGATFTGSNPNQTASKQYAVRYYAESALAAADAGALTSVVTYNIQYF